jgi:DNA-binding IclR family transcriptional regulator
MARRGSIRAGARAVFFMFHLRTEVRCKVARPALAATRAVDCLNLLAANPTQSFTLSELVQQLELNIASCHALVNVLTRQGFLQRHPKHKTYSLGPALVAIGHAALECHPAIDMARDEARELAQRLDLEVLITARIEGQLVALARAGRYLSANASLRVGQRVPLIPPLGSPFMAWAPAKEIKEWLARAADHASAEELAHYRDILDIVRARGFSVTLRNPVQRQLGEVVANLSASPHAAALRERMARLIAELGHNAYQLGSIDDAQRYEVVLLSAPIFDAYGQVAYTISLLGFRGALSAVEVEEYAQQVVASSLLVTRKSNGRLPVATAGL